MTLGRDFNQPVSSYDIGGAAEASQQQFNSLVQARKRQRRVPSQYQPQTVIDLASQSSLELMGSPTAVSTGKEASKAVGMVNRKPLLLHVMLAWTSYWLFTETSKHYSLRLCNAKRLHALLCFLTCC